MTADAEVIDPAVAYGTPKAAARQARLGYLPVSLFGSVMGSVGLSAALHQASRLFGAPAWISLLIGVAPYWCSSPPMQAMR